MIRARGLGRRFGTFVAVDEVSLDVAPGTLLALLGPNGAGKTTTVRMLAGLLAPSHGSACVAGCDVATDPAGVRARVGLVTDVPGLYEQMSPAAYLDFFGQLYGLDLAVRDKRIGDLLEMFDLAERGRDRMVTFSRGMQQKVALARALLHEPSVVFLDEPTAGLDPLAARAVRELIVNMKHARRGIVLCTHDLDEAERLADQVAILHGGRIVALDTPSRLRALASPETSVRVTLAPPYPISAPSGVVEFDTADPVESNPRVIADLVTTGARVVSVTCTTRSLEDVYATALNGELQAATRVLLEADVSASEVQVARPPGDLSALWLIARRAAVESLNDRLTRLMNVFFAFVAPLALLILAIRPLAEQATQLTASVLPFYLLVIGMMPAVGAVGIAAGQFAGERERGVLTPMLASPASNLAIFGGKVLGSILPPVLYSLIAQLIYLAGITVILGVDSLKLLPPGLSVAMLLLVPSATCLAAIIGTLVSSRVRTYNAAQQIAGILLIPLWALLFAVAFRLPDWGNLGLLLTVGGLVLLDVALTRLAAATWRREEVLSQR
ncbi:MAG: ATP-binding cassette domain-containing protein [Chloroflexi bacterium]|nr:ATP-binding cassette domain-containing protein [Chloroflexota bacterium]